jgi:hypothetical protein
MQTFTQIIDYNSSNIWNDYLLNEGKGIPNILKIISNHIYTHINSDINGEFKFSFNYNDFKFKDLTFKLENSIIKEIEGFALFGDMIGGYSTNSIIILRLNMNNYIETELSSTILHELVHLYEIFNRIKNKTKKDLSWKINNRLQEISVKYKSDKFLRDFSFLIYLSTDNEINAMVSEVYNILLEERTTDKNILLNKLYETSSYKKMKNLKDFKIEYYKIDLNLTYNFLTEFNNKINQILLQKFNLYNLPQNNEISILKSINLYDKLFKNKAIIFEQRLISGANKILGTDL